MYSVAFSALTECGGFPAVFSYEELSKLGLMAWLERACETPTFAGRQKGFGQDMRAASSDNAPPIPAPDPQ